MARYGEGAEYSATVSHPQCWPLMSQVLDAVRTGGRFGLQLYRVCLSAIHRTALQQNNWPPAAMSRQQAADVEVCRRRHEQVIDTIE